ncbi:MAG: hypothetical protein J5738_00625 [Lachnospiraceae bacterium]|nr:hypothetical protein [Lachnospiraceae bacterium]
MSKMAVWKYVFFGVLVFVACWISIELHHGYIDALDDFPTILLFSDNEEDAEAQMEHFIVLAEQCNVGTAFLSSTYLEDGSTCVCFYCDERVKERLTQYYHLYEGHSYAPFTGRYEIEYLPVSYVSSSDVQQMNCYPIVIPITENINGFLTEWERQNGRYLFKGIDNRFQEKITIGLIWGFLVCIIIIVSVFERMTECKEFFVRLSVGDSLAKQILTRIGVDMVWYIGVTFLIVTICGHIFGPMAFVEYVWITAAALCASSMLLFGTLMRNSFRYSFSNAIMSEDSLLFGFLLIALFLVLLMVTATIGGTGLADYREVKEQKGFYNRFKDYYSVSFSPIVNDVASVMYDDSTEETITIAFQHADEMSTEFYNQYASISNACFIKESSFIGKYPIVCANGNAKGYLEEAFGRVEADSDIVILYPKRLSVSLLQQYELQKAAYDYQDGKSVTWIPYTNDISISLTADPTTELPRANNPIVVFTSGNSMAENRLVLGKVFYNISEDTILRYAQENQVKAYYCSVGQAYSRQYEMSKHQSIGVLGIAALIGILDSVLLLIICYYECSVNRWEIAIKKTLGCSRFERYYRLYLLVLFSDILGVIAAKYVAKRLGIGSRGVEYIFLAVLLIIQLLEVLLVTRKIERESVNKVLKNG